MWAALMDLVLPSECVGCGVPGGAAGICAACVVEVRQVPIAVRPSPVPVGLPVCLAAGVYEGVVRAAILGYKERGRRGLARLLGDTLGSVVQQGWPDPAVGPVALVPVPATAAAIRARYGDHMLRLARRARRYLSERGYAVAVAPALRALPKPDSVHLDRDQRAIAAREAFAARAGWAPVAGSAPPRWVALQAVADRGAVVLLDDVLTTGATLAAAAGRLVEVGIPVTYAATIAATRLRGTSDPSWQTNPSLAQGS